MIVLVLMSTLTGTGFFTYSSLRNRVGRHDDVATWRQVGQYATTIASLDGRPVAENDVADALQSMPAGTDWNVSATPISAFTSNTTWVGPGRWVYSDDGPYIDYVIAQSAGFAPDNQVIFIDLANNDVVVVVAAGIGDCVGLSNKQCSKSWRDALVVALASA